MVEAAVIVIGVVALLTVVVLRQDHAGAAAADASTLTVTGQALVAARVIAPEVRPTTGERTEPGRRPLTHRHRPALTTSLGKNGLNTVVRNCSTSRLNSSARHSPPTA
jgi:hypothetical protein